MTGIQVFNDYSLAELRDFIDWTPFFVAWELAGRFPRILDDATVGAEARKLYDDALEMLDMIIQEKMVYGARRLRPVPGQRHRPRRY